MPEENANENAPQEQEQPQGQEQETPKPTPPSWTPPSREEWEKVTLSLRETSAESRKRKERLRELESATATEDERRAAEVAERARAEAEGLWRPRFVASEARSALASAGCRDLARMARLVDMGAVEILDDGTVTGLEEQVSSLKTDYPEAFRRERIASVEKVASPGGARPVPKKQSATQKQVAAMFGSR